jgi:hypothetical protein
VYGRRRGQGLDEFVALGLSEQRSRDRHYLETCGDERIDERGRPFARGCPVRPVNCSPVGAVLHEDEVIHVD